MHLRKLWVLLLLLPTLALAQQVQIPAGWTDGFVYANGIRMHYYRAAGPTSGKPVMVMVHGVTDNGLCWTTLTLKLQEAYDIYMLDTRGHGLSDPFLPGDNGETLVKDVAEFVKAMEFKKPILMGHSMGAAMVMRAAADYPDLARAVIMLDPIFRLTSSGPPPAPTSGASRTTPSAITKPSPKPAPNRLSVNMFGSPETLVNQNNYRFEDLVATGRRQFPLWDSVDVRYWALSKKQYHGPYTPEASQAMTGTMNTGDALARIQVPALILKADASPEVRKSNEEAAKVMKKGKLIHMEGAGHNLHHDKLERTTQVLKEFLSTL